MSLLMEALRKAEEAKRKIHNQGTDAASVEEQPQRPRASVSGVTASGDNAFTLEEMEPAVTADYIVDKFLHREPARENSATRVSGPRLHSPLAKPTRASVEELQNYLETTPELEETQAVPRQDLPPEVSSTVQQRAAGAVFAAKQKPTQSHATRNIIFGLLCLFCAWAIWSFIGYNSSSLMIDPALFNTDFANRSLSDEQMNTQPATQALAQSPGPVTQITEQGQLPTTDTEITIARDPQTETPANPILPDTDVAEVPASPALPPAAGAAGIATLPETPDSGTPKAAAVDTAAANATVFAANPVQVLEVSHSKGTNNNQQLLDAYASLQAGDNASASAQYRHVLEQLPNNRDALLGSAAIAIREGNVSQAREYYSRLMQLNPKDPLARTGLLQTVQDIDPLQHEQELQRLLQQFPNVAPLSFALGNVYAAQQRWNEAQSAYFDAFLFARRGNETSISPDYAYNLAVSLEQINQPEAALDYYLQAQTLARAVTSGFDMQALSRRISFLEQSSP